MVLGDEGHSLPSFLDPSYDFLHGLPKMPKKLRKKSYLSPIIKDAKGQEILDTKYEKGFFQPRSHLHF